MRRTARNRILYLLMLAAIIYAVGVLPNGCGKKQAPAPRQKTASTPVSNANLATGNPSGATSDPSNKDNYLIEYPYFVLSYNDSKGTPNWVSWKLTSNDIGDAPRVPFYPDTDLPEGFQVITPSDYTGSGFDRGHMCPHQDRSSDEDMSRSTFVMTNIIPQSPTLNQRTWERLESYCRDLAQAGNILYIMDGPSGEGGEGRNGTAVTIGSTHSITVPSKCWKVIMVMPEKSGGDPAKINRRTRLIAVIMPNVMELNDDWSQYRVSVADVEHITGYTFFDKAPHPLIDKLKTRVDREPIPSSESNSYE